MASEGLAWRESAPVKNKLALKTPSSNESTLMDSNMPPIASTKSIKRSWVSGRGEETACCARAIAVASGVPIQIGRYRSPAFSLSNTMG